MARNDVRNPPRGLLFAIFLVVFGLLLGRTVWLWKEIDAGERTARITELLLIAAGAWVVVWPESFPRWRSSKDSRNDP